MDLDKAKGTLFGLAIGDALGRETEFISLEEIKARCGPKGVVDLPDPALYTDDTQMSLAVAEALVRAGDRDIETIMGEIKSEFIRWYHSPENIQAPGAACLRGVANLVAGVPWNKSGDPGTKGCGSAMRVAPIGYFYQHFPMKLRAIAHASGICTHAHPTADAAAIGTAYLVKLALDGIEPGKMVSELLAFTEGLSREWEEAIRKVETCRSWPDEEKALNFLGEGWVGEEAVALALYCFLRYPGDYEKVVLRGANTNGDSDSIASIAGGISGAYLGIEAIPKTWIAKIDRAVYLEDLALRLAQKKTAYDRVV